MKKELNNIIKGKVVILGIGNMLRGDDSAGCVLVKNLSGKIPAACIDAGTAPESYADKIIKERPDVVLIVDATDMNKEPGSYAILEKSDILKSGFTTHDISPKMFMEYLENQASASIYMLGIQPKNIAIGDEMSYEVEKTLKEIEGLMMEVLCDA